MAEEPPQKIESTADLARYLNMSQWSVSRAINGHKGVSEETRKRVLRGYGFRYLFETTMGEEEREISVIRDFQRFGVDGIVNINSILKASDLDELLSPVPSVLVEPVHRDTGKTPRISVDRDRAMSAIIHHLYELGHRRFAMIGINRYNLWRWDPAVDTVTELGLDPEQALLPTREYKEKGNYMRGGRVLIEEFLEIPEDQRPKALICLDDSNGYSDGRLWQDDGSGPVSTSYDMVFSVQSIPEASTLAYVLVLGLSGMVLAIRRRR